MSGISTQDRRWLDAAVRLARPALGTGGASPVVGVVIVDETHQVVISRAATPSGGRPHAELQALSDARGEAAGHTLYVTLEPSARRGRTPPVADAIVQAGIGRVVVGMLDPDPARSGAGVARLRQAGLVVDCLDHAQSRQLHEDEVTRVREGRPFVTARLAVSADGMVGLRGQGRVTVCGDEASRWTQMQRALHDAVMIGARSAGIDNPTLDVALAGLEQRIRMRVIALGTAQLDPRLDIIAGVSGHPTLLLCDEAAAAAMPAGVEVLRVPGRKGRPDLRHGLGALAARGTRRLLVEGGPALVESLLGAELIDRFHLLRSDVRLGRSGVPATPLGGIEGRLHAAGFTEVDRRLLGADMMATYERDL